MSFFFFLFFLLSLNWERERERESIQRQYLGRVEGENGFMLYLAFRRRVSSESIFFNGLVGFCGARFEACAISCPRALLHFFTRSLAWDSPFRSWRPPSTKLIFFIPISADEKGCYLRFRILANHLASFFFLHPVRRFVRTTITSQHVPFFIHLVTECKHLLAFILTWICYFGREELAYISYSSF